MDRLKGVISMQFHNEKISDERIRKLNQSQVASQEEAHQLQFGFDIDHGLNFIYLRGRKESTAEMISMGVFMCG